MLGAIIMTTGLHLPAFAGESTAGPTVVMVHGLFADGSSWQKVIRILQSKGVNVVSVQNPLTSLADDVAATNAAIDLQSGPVVLVGHSWGGVVITEAGNNPKVTGLVYVSAFAPGSGQSINDLVNGLPPAAWLVDLVRDERGFLKLSESGVAKYFAPDVAEREQEVLYATQGPFPLGLLGDKVTRAAGQRLPSWWVLPENDQIIDPRLQAAMAAGINSTVTRIASSHVAMSSHPREVAEVILRAVAGVE
jgi:pimeloyl-ACP methyl ester carboxylesterase